MGRHHLIRVGVLGRVGRFTSVDAVTFPRHSQVVVRTSRGLERGEVLASPGAGDGDHPADGSLLRGMTPEDHLLAARLDDRRTAAAEACASRLASLNQGITLLDVEHLFDGRTIWFYFLGEATPEVESLVAELAEVYEAEVQFRRFSDTLVQGCGPECGTEHAPGGCSTCATGCGVSSVCATRKPKGTPA